MSLLFNMLSRLVITFLPRSKHLLISWLQSPAAVIIAVILEPKIKSLPVPPPLYLPWRDGTRCHDLSFLNGPRISSEPLFLGPQQRPTVLCLEVSRILLSAYYQRGCWGCSHCHAQDPTCRWWSWGLSHLGSQPWGWYFAGVECCGRGMGLEPSPSAV